MVYLLAFVLTFLNVALRAAQQQNVIYRRKALVVPVSYGMALVEMFNVTLFVTTFMKDGYTTAILLALVMGTAGWMGCLVSMSFHEKLTKYLYHWDK